MNIENLTKKSEEASTLLGLLANPHRLRILCELHKGERSVSHLEQVIDLSQSALSQHLAKLRAAEAVKTRRASQTIYYSIADQRLSRLLGVMYELFCGPSSTGRSATKRGGK
jgi:ArsR family transcriptional regulator, virulence genes transcriptional regulator